MVESKDVENQLKQIEKILQASVEKSVLEEKFIEEANDQFEINLVALKKYFPEIYDKYINFSPKEQFNLFLNDNGSPNLVDYDTNCPIYSADPISQVKD
ncbi:maf protein, partial [Pseudoalteromonas aurantia]